MNNTALIIQDLMDIIHIQLERVTGYNRAAYGCENLQLKMVLNKEIDQTRDAILVVRRLLMERFDIVTQLDAKGPLFDLWKAFKPSLEGTDMRDQLLDFELAGLLTLQCYCVAIQRSYIDIISKDLLEFQYQSNLVSYYNLKVLRETLRKSKQVILHQYKQTA